jgi:hypothetical protein
MMEKLKHDWLTEGLIDFEYKKYVLLAYLKDVKKRFNQSELYPFMSDLIFHYRNLLKVKENKELIYENFPKTLTRVDFEKLQLTYKKIMEDSDIMKEMEDIIAYALPRIEETLEEGRELFEFVEEHIELLPVGVSPIYANEGYLFINVNESIDVAVYRYQVTFFEHAEEKYRNITTRFIGNEMKSINKTFENLKIYLSRTFTELPNPATFLASVKLVFPVQETVLPVAKRMLVREISA